MPQTQHLDAIIIGAGISGLCAGWALKKARKRYHILEKSHRPGGPIQTIQEDDFQFELGPNTIQVDGADIDALFKDLGLENEVIEANKAANTRYIVRNHKPEAVPMGPAQLLSSKLFTKRALLSVLAEPFKKKYSENHDESLGNFVKRRLNQEFLDYAINPLIGGIYAGDPEKLSVKYGFPKIYNLEANYGSLIKGSLGIRKERKRLGTQYKTKLISFKRGMEQLPQALADKQRDSIRLESEISSITQEKNGEWIVTYRTAHDSVISVRSAKLIIACPASGILSLPFEAAIVEKLQLLTEIPHPPVTGLSLGFTRRDIEHALNGFGMLIPEVEKLSILGCLFSSTLFEGRAPKGQAALTVFVGGTRNPELTQLNDQDLISKVTKDLNKLLGVRGKPSYFRRTDWPRAIPQYIVGFKKYFDLFEAIEIERPGLKFIGHIKDGISVPKCIRSGLQIA